MNTEQALKDEIAGRALMDAQDVQAEMRPPTFDEWYYDAPDEDGRRPSDTACKSCSGSGNDERDEGFDSKKYPCQECDGTGSAA